MGFGVFMGITPFWGYQIWLAIGLAHFLKLNKVIVAIFSNISIPPFIPFLLYGSYYAGAKMLGKSTDLPFSSDLSIQDVWTYLQPYLYGSFLLAFVAGVCVSTISYAALHIAAKFSVKK